MIHVCCFTSSVKALLTVLGAAGSRACDDEEKGFKPIFNGTLIQDVDQTEDENMRDKPHPRYISLQDHRYFVEYRNIRLTER